MSHRTSYIGGFASQRSQGRVLAMLVALATATPSPMLDATPEPTLSATPTTAPRWTASERAKPHLLLASFIQQPTFSNDLSGNGERVTTVTRTLRVGQGVSYTYDSLYRLTAADYSDGKYFHYGYDAVGNRQSQTVTGGLVTTYTYDIANRLTQVGGTQYQWDANGNLVNDGASAYGYCGRPDCLVMARPE